MSFSAQTTVALDKPAEALGHILEHLREHELTPVTQPDGSVFIEIDQTSQIRVAPDDETLTFHVKAPSQNTLYFFKESVVRHLEEISAEAAQAVRWSDNTNRSSGDSPAFPINFQLLQFVRKSAPFPGMMRLTFTSETDASKRDITALLEDGIHVKLMLPSHAGRQPIWPHVAANGTTVWPQGKDELHVRYYTLKEIRVDQNEVDIDIVAHSGGKIADWAATAASGDQIGLMGPGGGDKVPEDCSRVLLAADETALPALAHMLAHLPPNCTGHVVAALPKEATSYLPETPLQITCLPSETFAARIDETLASLAAAPAPEQAPDFCWFAGEYNNAQSLRQMFKQTLGLKKGRQLAISYWKEGRTGDAKGTG
ncbi:siderophore-interacting protein [Roseibium algae]|uniref:Siderophore-interacting protein n=1 Tax=Roseibium algae TaxID=3123038 RepID=A0ABU8TFL1_9HYPH